MKIGYIRISTVDQNTARQEVMMQELGVEQVYIEREGIIKITKAKEVL